MNLVGHCRKVAMNRERSSTSTNWSRNIPPRLWLRSPRTTWAKRPTRRVAGKTLPSSSSWLVQKRRTRLLPKSLTIDLAGQCSKQRTTWRQSRHLARWQITIRRANLFLTRKQWLLNVVSSVQSFKRLSLGMRRPGLASNHVTKLQKMFWINRNVR